MAIVTFLSALEILSFSFFLDKKRNKKIKAKRMLRRFAGQRHVTSLLLNKPSKDHTVFQQFSGTFFIANDIKVAVSFLCKIKIEKHHGRSPIN